MSKDVIIDKYARLYEIPNQLSQLGHQLECYCLSYQSHQQGIWDESTENKKLIWHAHGYLGLKKICLFTYPYYLLKRLKANPPDLIIAASDIPHIILGAWLAKKLDIQFVADLYDNFESYGQAKIPLFKTALGWALNRAAMISTTSSTLANHIQQSYPNVKQVVALPSVIDSALFNPGNQHNARLLLNLPLNGYLIGTAGGLTKMKAIDDLLKAWELVKTERENIYLVLAGPTEVCTPLPDDAQVIYLGLLEHASVNLLFQALDLGVICIPDDDFGRYCFPQKAYEMLATQLPIISTAVGDMCDLLPDECLYPATQYHLLAKRILMQMSNASDCLDIPIPTWEQSIAIFNRHMLSITLVKD